jgi:hypothetical protein
MDHSYALRTFRADDADARAVLDAFASQYRHGPAG